MRQRERPRDALIPRGRETGEPAGEEGADVVDCCGGVEVGGEKAFGIGEAVVDVDSVDVVAAASLRYRQFKEEEEKSREANAPE